MQYIDVNKNGDFVYSNKEKYGFVFEGNFYDENRKIIEQEDMFLQNTQQKFAEAEKYDRIVAGPFLTEQGNVIVCGLHDEDNKQE